MKRKHEDEADDPPAPVHICAGREVSGGNAAGRSAPAGAASQGAGLALAEACKEAAARLQH